MRSRWNDEEARRFIEGYAHVGEDLALRTYSARLLGADPALVLHGGGNTSVKTRTRDLFGDEIDILHIKGSGWDLATIEPAGHPAVQLAPLLRLRGLASLSDEAMVNAQRQNLLDSTAATPSVETLLHAFLPAKFIDHTHAVAVLAIANQPDGRALIEDVYSGRVGIVPYVMPGFDLAQAAAMTFEAHPEVEGLILVHHGVFSFGETARQSYERMIALVDSAERSVERRRASAAPARPRAATTAAQVSNCLPAIRGALSRAAGNAWPSRWIFDLRDDGVARAIAERPDLADLASRGVATPDHVIRTKRFPLMIPEPTGDLGAWAAETERAVAAFADAYRAYFAGNASRFPAGTKALDPLPRLVAIAGVGLAGVGANARAAQVAADIGESWAETVFGAEAVGRFTPLGEADTFDMEYWSLEQAKLGKSAEKRLERRVIVVSGGAGAIGSATGAAFAAEGAEVALLDIDAEAVASAASRLGGAALGLACDVTDAEATRSALAAVVRRFGGVDIVVSNAGAAFTGMLAEISDEALRASFEINLFAHQNLARAAVAVMRRQAMGGVLLFNVSKQAINPGPDFGAYGTAKAAELALMRQYALEHAAEGIRANAVNPDRIRSGLLTNEMVAARAVARGVEPAAYMKANLLGEEVSAADVAQAFVFATLMAKTTGAVFPVDGGNVAAMLR